MNQGQVTGASSLFSFLLVSTRDVSEQHSSGASLCNGCALSNKVLYYQNGFYTSALIYMSRGAALHLKNVTAHNAVLSHNITPK